MQLQLVKKQPLTSNIVSFFWSAPEPITWRAGQYGVFYLPHPAMDTSGPERFFTISNPPHAQSLCFTTRISASSYKQALNAMTSDDTINLQSIGGEFVITNPKTPHIFVAFGIGITPFRSILLDVIHHQTPLQVQIFFQHRPNERLFQDDFNQVEKYTGAPINHFNQPDQLTDALAQQLHIHPDSNTKFYLSGPIPLVEKVEELLITYDIPIDNIYSDYFEYDWSQTSA